MKIIVDVKDFIKFLNDKNALEKFTHNISNERNLESVKGFFKRCSTKKWVCGAFTWSNSKEGIHYWESINDMWESSFPPYIKEVITTFEEKDIEIFYQPKIYGKKYNVTSVEFSRMATPDIEGSDWGKFLTTVHSIDNFKDALIVSDHPEIKRIVVGDATIVYISMIKVWCPKLCHARWVVYNPSNIYDRMSD